MSKMNKKYLKILIAAVMICVLSCVSITAFAAGDNDDAQTMSVTDSTKDTFTVDSLDLEAQGAIQSENAQQPLQAEQMKKSSSSDEKITVGGVLSSFGIGLLIAVIVCVAIFVSYKKHGATEPYRYNEKTNLALSESSDILVDTKINKRKIDKD